MNCFMNKPKIIQFKLKFLSKPTLLVLLLGCNAVGDVYADSNKAINLSLGAAELVSIQQNSTITGKVVSADDNMGIPGVNVTVKGVKGGVSTDFDGNYSINVSSSQAILVFTSVGFKTQEIKVGSQTSINIKLQADVASLNEVVVVGYGTIKKATLTGSVTQVKGDEVLKGKATNNIAAALQGEIPGLVITRTSSRPGNEGIDITLRGGISVNATAPMILIDGVEAYGFELSQINADDVDTVSVLKDGAAAIYGTRAGGGVILITTKRGKSGKTKISYSGSSHVNMLGKRFPVADGKTWGKMFIDTVTSDAFALGPNNPQYNWWIWSESVYRAMAAGERVEGVNNNLWRVLDPNVNQFDAVYGDTWGKDHNLSFSGGNENLKAYTSLGYSDDRSLIDVVYDGQKKYNFRTNIDYKVNDWIKTDFNVSYDKRTVSSPINGIGHGIQDFYIFPLYNTYGQFYDTFGNNNLLAKLTEGGRKNNTDNILRLGGKLTLDLGKITKGLSVSGSANMRQLNTLLIERNNKITMYDWSGETTNPTGLPDYTLGTGSIKSQTTALNTNVKNTNIDGFYQVYNAIVAYNREFSGHNIGLIAGMTSEKFHEQKFVGFRKNLSNNLLDDINLGDATTAEATGGSFETGLVSYLGRLNYDYKGIFLLEGNFRRDGSSKFTPENRWANFGGISAGVRLSELPSLKKLNIFDNLKIRSSYGETGSQTGIGNYDYISGVSTGTTIFGYTGALSNTSSVASITSTERTWERVASTNLAIDFDVLNNRLGGTFEIFERENKGMLIPVVYPQALGGIAPRTNSGNFVAKGWELTLNWKDKINDNLRYKVGVTLTDARTEVTYYPGAQAINRGLNSPVYSGSGAVPTYIEGKPLNALYVYKTDGYLQNTAEVAAYYTAITQTTGGEHPVQGTSNQLTPGSVRKVDLNNDGKITTDDLYYYGDASPHYLFGLNLGLNYKNFDFKMFIQGVGQQNNLREGSLANPWNALFTNQNATFYGQTWTPENPNARYPVMSQNGARNNWNYKWANDININNNWYARAKNVALGYTLPKTLLNRMLIDNLRIYVSGDNLFEVSNVKDGFDPESKAATGQGNVDVYSRTLSFGIDLSL
jgi:TonB-linked SusC/RagA family outer membrane protein